MEFDVGYGAPLVETARPEGMREGGTETPEGAMI